MKVLLSAVQEKSFTKASVKQHMSQPAVTIIIGEIEELAGCKLFVRAGNTRTTTLTNEGENFAGVFSKIVAQYETAIQQLEVSVSGKKAWVDVLIQKSFAIAIRGDWLRSLQKTFDGSHVRFHTATRDEILEKINSQDACLGLIDGDTSNLKADSRTILTDQVCALVRHTDFAGKHSINWSDLPSKGIVHTGISRSAQLQIRQALKGVEIESEGYVEVDSDVLITKLLADDLAVALTPSLIGSVLEQEEGLRCIELRGPRVDVPMRIVMPWGRMHSTRFETLSPAAVFVGRHDD
ncbi:LysR family transcriptional regulator [uncultured Tateyamaria sp.]|uniref:LysR family transcriptional regulator n=1 Tax=uncultured Tateyamaria sp. TaxID=455651 RepID=UPI0026358CCA|nr:LysR family transcriptional regulator [uncultured Tateyamaria sp.]